MPGAEGTGRWRTARTTLVEDCEVMPVAAVVAAVVAAGRALAGLEMAELVVEVGSYQGGVPRVRVALVTTCPTYGGRRWWLVCPRCDRRAGKLYRPHPWQGFACRCCYGLTYHSQRLAKANRWELRSERLKDAVMWRGIQLHADDDMYYKPPRMHWRTFHRIIDDVELYADAAFAWRIRGWRKPNSWICRLMAGG